MAEHIEFGKKGEEKALEYLIEQGFTLIAQNWRAGHLEIDIIAEKDNIIHFIEVKTRKKNSLIPARESLNFKKRQNLERLVELWFHEHAEVEKSAQLDFIAIDAQSLKENNKKGYSLEYYPNYTQL